mmetsp:Transcript_45127/g.84420  ORF Transcript_45127/g.84420 Transcript_45127/m.84420 type:complete len:500 (+) Transcript_45127:25-1524(+)
MHSLLSMTARLYFCMPVALLLMVSLSSGSAGELRQTPQRMSPFQQEVWAAKAKIAENESIKALPALLSLLQNAEFRGLLEAEGLGELANQSGTALLARLRGEVRLSEFTTAFPASDAETERFGQFGHSVACGLPNVSTARKAQLHYNSWELQLRGMRHCDSEQDTEDYMQRLLFGCREFKAGTGRPSTVEEARNRIVYSAVNIRRLDLAECQYGSVRLVLSTPYVRKMGLIAPVDSGWLSSCFRQGTKLNCSDWMNHYRVGTFDHFDHTILDHARLISNHWNGSAAAALAHLFVRLVRPQHLSLSTGADVDMFGYLEAGLLGNVIYSQGMNFVIARFQDLYGTKTGEEVMEWCQSYSWPLLWTLGIMPMDGICNWEMWEEGHYEGFKHPRLLEPQSSLAVNVSLGRDAAAKMSSLWVEVAAARSAANASLPASAWHSWWARASAAVSPSGQLRPLQVGKCHDAEACIGVNLQGDCVKRLAQVPSPHHSSESELHNSVIV